MDSPISLFRPRTASAKFEKSREAFAFQTSCVKGDSFAAVVGSISADKFRKTWLKLANCTRFSGINIQLREVFWWYESLNKQEIYIR
jgi:hypothetical protein